MNKPSLRMVLFGIVDIAQGLVMLLTIGMLRPQWTLRLAVYFARRDVFGRRNNAV